MASEGKGTEAAIFALTIVIIIGAASYYAYTRIKAKRDEARIKAITGRWPGTDQYILEEGTGTH